MYLSLQKNKHTHIMRFIKITSKRESSKREFIERGRDETSNDYDDLLHTWFIERTWFKEYETSYFGLVADEILIIEDIKKNLFIAEYKITFKNLGKKGIKNVYNVSIEINPDDMIEGLTEEEINSLDKIQLNNS